MKRIIPLSLIAVASLYAAEIELAPISVEAVELTEVSQNVQVSSDIAEALAAKVPSIDMIRRSGIANDVHIRGQKRDNISVEVDGTKIFGACPNRMDPPTSHILASQVDEVTVTEGPYDIETFGTMSGGVKMTTKQPSKELHGEVTMGVGSWNYRKVSATVSGGNDTIRVLISASSEASDQYKDGDDKTMAEQIEGSKTGTGADASYKPEYEDVGSYKKKSLMAKAFVTVTDDQELRLSYTQNKSDNVLYPNTPMDAVYDYSNIYSVEYDIKDLTDIYKNVNLQYYYSEVDHPMDNAYRVSAAGPVTTHHLSTSMQGLKLKNSFDIESYKLLVGLDGSKRVWDGAYALSNGMKFDGEKSINNVSTRNAAIFTKLEKSYGDFSFTIGARYDSTDIDPAGTQESNSYSAFNANLFTSYNLDKENRLFLGFGQASRVPDPRELYYISKTSGAPFVREDGTPTLDQTTNQEIDLGYEASYDMFSMKIKGFYSMLKDYIYFNSTAAKNKFTNIDATIYGAELTSSVYATDDITVDMGVSYKRGEKDEALNTQDDKDLADITPLRGNLAVNYEYMANSIVTAEVQASDKWSDFDEDNGEQELDAWTIVNLKVKHAVNKNFDFTLGVNNLFDETYAVSNTYADLNLVAGGGDVTLLNEPGRYFYTNLTFKF